jgi:hypothetical protein
MNAKSSRWSDGGRERFDTRADQQRLAVVPLSVEVPLPEVLVTVQVSPLVTGAVPVPEDCEANGQLPVTKVMPH